MALPNYICSQVNLPICKTLNIEPTVYNAFETSSVGIKLCAPYTLALLFISIFCAVRMISQVDSLFSSIGRSEMKTVFYLYIMANFLLIPTLCFEKYFDSSILKFLNVLQNSFMSTTYFSLCVSGFTIDKIYGIFGMKSATFMRTLCSLYFVLVSTFIYLFVSMSNKEIITILLGFELIFMISYLSTQSHNLKKNKGEIWGFGVLGVIFAFFILSKLHTLLAADLVAELSERNLDNMFFNICYTFLVVIMCHKFWLTTYDFELECLALYE